MHVFCWLVYNSYYVKNTNTEILLEFTLSLEI